MESTTLSRERQVYRILFFLVILLGVGYLVFQVLRPFFAALAWAVVLAVAKAEQYSKKAIELTPTLPKPATVTDESFSAVKSQTLAMAHSGLGLVYIRRGQFSEAIPELNQSVTLDPTPDPVNYYLLGMANAKASHFDDSASAYNKCAAIIGSMQETCKKGAEEAKKLAGTQLSAPK